MGSKGYALAAHFILMGRSERNEEQAQGICPGSGGYRTAPTDYGGNGCFGTVSLCADGGASASAHGNRL